jgi:hypothetical protein
LLTLPENCAGAVHRICSLELKMNRSNIRQFAQKGISYGSDLVSGRSAVVAFAGLLTAVGAQAQAAADPFDTALTQVTTATGKYAAALVGVAAIAVVFMVALKYVKKLPRAS